VSAIGVGNQTLELCADRDPKGLHKRARRGELKWFTGIDDPYEPPENPELRIDTSLLTPQGAMMILGYLVECGYFETDMIGVLCMATPEDENGSRDFIFGR